MVNYQHLCVSRPLFNGAKWVSILIFVRPNAYLAFMNIVTSIWQGLDTMNLNSVSRIYSLIMAFTNDWWFVH